LTDHIRKFGAARFAAPFRLDIRDKYTNKVFFYEMKACILAAKLHNRLRVFRADLDLTQRELAEQIGVLTATVNGVECGRQDMTLEAAIKASELFGVPVNLLFSLRPFPPLVAKSQAASVVSDVDGAVPEQRAGE
jgi:putative transcriptional regulator